MAATWFARLLRNGFALTVAGANPAFAEFGAGVLRDLLAGVLPRTTWTPVGLKGFHPVGGGLGDQALELRGHQSGLPSPRSPGLGEQIRTTSRHMSSRPSASVASEHRAVCRLRLPSDGWSR